MGILSDPDAYFMQEALKLAYQALQEDEVPVGCVIVVKDQIIAKSYNLVKKLHDPTAHAEMQAITQACHYFQSKYLHDCTMYITLEPCLMCASGIFWSQLGRLVYGAKDEKLGFERYQNIIHPKTKIESGILAQESSLILKDFFKGKR